MSELIEYAKENNPLHPFAAMIIETDTCKEICRGINNTSENPTYHGEIVAINNCVNNNKKDWKNYTLITTAESCPMCTGAIVWAGFGKLVYGTSIQTLINKGWPQILINSSYVTNYSTFNHVEVIGGVLKEETDNLFVDFNK